MGRYLAREAALGHLGGRVERVVEKGDARLATYVGLDLFGLCRFLFALGCHRLLDLAKGDYLCLVVPDIGMLGIAINLAISHHLLRLVEPLVERVERPRHPSRHLFYDGALECGHFAHYVVSQQSNVVLLVARAIRWPQAVGEDGDTRVDGPAGVGRLGRKSQELPVVAAHVVENLERLSGRKGALEELAPASAPEHVNVKGGLPAPGDNAPVELVLGLWHAAVCVWAVALALGLLGSE